MMRPKRIGDGRIGSHAWLQPKVSGDLMTLPCGAGKKFIKRHDFMNGP